MVYTTVYLSVCLFVSGSNLKLIGGFSDSSNFEIKRIREELTEL